MFIISQLELENLSSKSEEETIIKTQLNTHQKRESERERKLFSTNRSCFKCKLTNSILIASY
jgi:hypothetical protein